MPQTVAAQKPLENMPPPASEAVQRPKLEVLQGGKVVEAALDQGNIEQVNAQITADIDAALKDVSVMEGAVKEDDKAAASGEVDELEKAARETVDSIKKARSEMDQEVAAVVQPEVKPAEANRFITMSDEELIRYMPLELKRGGVILADQLNEYRAMMIQDEERYLHPGNQEAKPIEAKPTEVKPAESAAKEREEVSVAIPGPGGWRMIIPEAELPVAEAAPAEVKPVEIKPAEVAAPEKKAAAYDKMTLFGLEGQLRDTQEQLAEEVDEAKKAKLQAEIVAMEESVARRNAPEGLAAEAAKLEQAIGKFEGELRDLASDQSVEKLLRDRGMTEAIEKHITKRELQDWVDKYVARSMSEKNEPGTAAMIAREIEMKKTSNEQLIKHFQEQLKTIRERQAAFAPKAEAPAAVEAKPAEAAPEAVSEKMVVGVEAVSTEIKPAEVKPAEAVAKPAEAAPAEAVEMTMEAEPAEVEEIKGEMETVQGSLDTAKQELDKARADQETFKQQWAGIEPTEQAKTYAVWAESRVALAERRLLSKQEELLRVYNAESQDIQAERDQKQRELEEKQKEIQPLRDELAPIEDRFSKQRLPLTDEERTKMRDLRAKIYSFEKRVAKPLQDELAALDGKLAETTSEEATALAAAVENKKKDPLMQKSVEELAKAEEAARLAYETAGKSAEEVGAKAETAETEEDLSSLFSPGTASGYSSSFDSSSFGSGSGGAGSSGGYESKPKAPLRAEGSVLGIKTRNPLADLWNWVSGRGKK